MGKFIEFLTKIKSFWKFYRDYDYDGETVKFIIDTYEKLLCERTSTMSKPIYQLKDILAEIDKWYKDRKSIDICETYDYHTRRINFSVDFRNIETMEEFVNSVIDAMMEKIENGEFLK